MIIKKGTVKKKRNVTVKALKKIKATIEAFLIQ